MKRALLALLDTICFLASVAIMATGIIGLLIVLSKLPAYAPLVVILAAVVACTFSVFYGERGA